MPIPGITEHWTKYSPRERSAVLYHASIGTPIAEFLAALDAPLIVDYHNVTPMHFYSAFEPHIAALLYAGRSECSRLSDRALLGIADSDYSSLELKEMGYKETATVPILLDFSKYEQPADQHLLNRLVGSKKGADILFVGRLSPNKRQEDVIKAFAVYKRHYDPGSRLFLVGQTASHRYVEVLKFFIERLSLDDVHIVGGVSDAQLFAHYRAADIFLSMSEHEGFCVPILECMVFELPMICFSATAVPETVAGAGILVDRKHYDEIAAITHLVVGDSEVRARLVEAGKKRLDYFRPENHEGRLARLIDEVLA